MPQTLNYNKVKSETGFGQTPVGTILPWSKSVAPTGFLKCDGSAVSRTTYADLFDVIGTTYGVGDGSTTFNLPDLTSRALVGSNTSTNVGQTGGASDTTGAGFAIQNNLATQVTQNLGTSTTQNLSTSDSQNLSVQTTQNLAASTNNNLSTQVSQNLAGGVTQNLAYNVSGNIDNHTLSLAQIPSHGHPGTVNTPVNGFRESEGQSFTMHDGVFGSAGSNQEHNHGHNFSGSIGGNVSGNVTGNIGASASGNIDTNITGTAASNITGSVSTNLTGDVSTNITGNVSTNIDGDVTADNVSLYEPHLVVTYIVKH